MCKPNSTLAAHFPQLRGEAMSALSRTDTDTDTDTGIDIDIETGTGTGTNADTDAETDTNTGTDTNTDTDTNIVTDTDPDTDIATNIVIGYHRLSPALPPTLSPTSLPTPRRSAVLFQMLPGAETVVADVGAAVTSACAAYCGQAGYLVRKDNYFRHDSG